MTDAYVVCTSPRSGSTLLCRLLTATGRAGAPDSHFHEPDLGEWLEDYGLDRAAFASEREAAAAAVAAALARGRDGGDLFGLRLQRHSFDHLMARLDLLHPGLPSDAARLHAAFGRTVFIHLTRGDKLAQAISYVKAEQSGLWHRHADGREMERLAPPREPQYDGARIARERDVLTAMDSDWRRWFAREGLDPLIVTYEALAADPAHELARVLAALGRDPTMARGIAPPVARLTDAVNRDWAERFRGESRDG